MGNLFTFFSNSDDKIDSDSFKQIKIGKEKKDEFALMDFSNLDIYNKIQLLDFLKNLKPKSIHFPDDFNEKMMDIEIENSQLLPMCMELYQKMYESFGEYKPIIDTSKIKKRFYFVRPKFEIDQVKKSIETIKPIIHSDIDTNLLKINPFIVSMKMDDINLDEYDNSFNNNLAKKDMMGLNKNILKHMPKYMKIRFINTFNKILNDLSKVDKISLGRGSYIYKAGKHGPTNDINSFRQILSIPNAVNQLHRILVLRLNNFLHLNKYMDTNIQKGGITGQKFAIFEQFFKVKNVIKNANKNKKSCAILFLDIRNAFGNLNLKNLYKILELYHVDAKFIAYLKEFYVHFEYYVDTQGIKTETFKWNDGLIQGCSLSQLLFVLAMNYILTHIDTEYKNNLGYDIDGITKILLTAYIDDICIICKDIGSLNIVYKKLSQLLKILGLTINKEKCAIMVINDKTNNHDDFDQIQKVNVFKYLGEYLSNDGSSTESYTQFLRFVTRKLKVIDGKNLLNEDKLKMFDTYILPWIQRKTLTMYDISMTKRLKIISLIKPYLEKWGHCESINIFSNITPIINDSIDIVISNVKFDDKDFDNELEQNIELANYVLKDTSIKLEYSQINENFQLDIDLEDYDEIND